MKIFLKHYLQLSLLGFFLVTSCDKTTVSKINPEVDITGQWDLLVVRSSIDLKNGEDTNNDENFEGLGLFFEFKTDGTYRTNTSINLGSVSKSDQVITGTYIKTEEQIQLEYSFEDFGINANISLDIAELSDKSLVLVLTEKSLIQAFDENLGQLDPFARAAAELFLGNIVELETRIEMTR